MNAATTPAEFSIRKLGVYAYGNGATVWGYKHGGTLAEIDAPHFFDAARDILVAGDAIWVHMTYGAALRAVRVVGVDSVIIGPLL